PGRNSRRHCRASPPGRARPDRRAREIRSGKGGTGETHFPLSFIAANLMARSWIPKPGALIPPGVSADSASDAGNFYSLHRGNNRSISMKYATASEDLVPGSGKIRPDQEPRFELCSATGKILRPH